MKPAGKLFAIWGLLFEAIFFVSLPYSIIGILDAFTSMAASGSAELSAIAPQLSNALYPLRFTFPIAAAGDLFLLIALFKFQYRSRWFLCAMWFLSVLWLPRFPIGTGMGIISIIRLRKMKQTG
ncbi:hypothetical protein P4C99_09700 [Pontiellaceae bacterium B1224]|nr:hypothetical protein [Pontiellaceae bacterium B1224]